MVYILSHQDLDGAFSAYCAWRHYRNTIQHHELVFHEVQYNRPFPLDVSTLTKDDTVYILDFSYPAEILDPVFAVVGKLQVLDHHESSRDYLLGKPYAFFDLTKSGALLAWEYFFPEEPPPLACLLVNDRDLWAKQYGKQTAYFNEWLHYDRAKNDWEKWHQLCIAKVAMERALDNGELLYEKLLSELTSFTNNPTNYIVGEDYLEQSPITHKRKTKFILYNGNYTAISELGEAFYTKYPDAVTIDYRVRNALVTFSIRSPNLDVFNAKQYCVARGGGGHPKSAGFGLPRKEAFEYIEYLYSKQVN